MSQSVIQPLIFAFSDYRLFLRAWLQESKQTQPKLTFALVAADIGMQAPAFSKVINGDSDLTSDQAFLLCRRLRMNDDERAYFQLLLDHERSALSERKQELETARILMQRKHLNTPIRVATEDTQFVSEADRSAYFANPWAAIIHMYLTIPRYQVDVGSIGTQLQLPAGFLHSTLALLRRMGLAREFTPGKWTSIEHSVHSMDLAGLPAAHQLLFRSIALQRLSVLPLKERYGLSVVYSADEATNEASRQILINAVTEIHKLVTASTPTSVYQLSIDLFPWNEAKS